MEKHPVKQVKVAQHLDKMLEIDKELYEKILDTPGFAYHFNQICLLAETGENWYSVKDLQ